MDTLRGRPTGSPLRLVVGVTDAMPKLVVRRLLDPALRLDEPVRLVVEEDRHERMLARLALHELDVVLADAPIPPGQNIRAFNHLLGQCGISLCATPELAASLRPGFPGSLDGAPFLVPSRETVLRRALEQWLDRQELRPVVHAEIEDSALLNMFGRDGLGVFAVPSVIEQAVEAQHGAEVIGRAEGITESFYAISAERRIRNPAVAAITEAARHDLFG
jgi:LysR family transcriptional activator of nhaA